MVDPRSLEEVRSVLHRHREFITRTYAALGTGIGKREAESNDYAITVYLRSQASVPTDPVSIEGVELKFVITGDIVPLQGAGR